LKDCEAALKIDEGLLSAYLLKGDALWALNRKSEAQQIWTLALSKWGDVYVHDLLSQRLKGEHRKRKLTQVETALSNLEVTSSTSGNTLSDHLGSSLRYSSEKEENNSLLKEKRFSQAVNAVSEVASRGLVQHGVGNQKIDSQIGKSLECK